MIRTRKDFGLSLTNELPHLGSASRGLRVISESWNASKNLLTLETSGAAGQRYELSVWNPAQVSSVEGAHLQSRETGDSDASRDGRKVRTAEGDFSFRALIWPRYRPWKDSDRRLILRRTTLSVVMDVEDHGKRCTNCRSRWELLKPPWKRRNTAASG